MTPSRDAAEALPAWSLALQGPEYGLLVPAMGALPDPVAYMLARARGRFNAGHDRDWVSLGLGHRHVAQRVAQGCGMFVPAEQVEATVRERFETVAREEMEARALARYGLQHFDIDALEALNALDHRPRDRGLVLVTAHVETFVLGIAALARRGEAIHPVMSSVTTDLRLHPAVRGHYARKYEGLQRHLQGGELAPAETAMRHFYKALARKEVVVVLCDSPAPAGSPALWVPWFGARRGMAQGAFRLAAGTGSMLAAFACRWLTGRRHAVHLSTWIDARTSDPAATAAQAFAFLESHIRARPGRWWASHLLPSCGTADEVGPQA